MKPEFVLDLDLEPELPKAPRPRYAGFGVRFVAFVLDSVALMLLISLPLYMAFGWERLAFLWQTPPAELMDQYIALLYDPVAARAFIAAVREYTASMLVHNGILLLIYVVFWVRFLGTPGKLWLGL